MDIKAMLILLPDGKQTLISIVLPARNPGKLVAQCLWPWFSLKWFGRLHSTKTLFLLLSLFSSIFNKNLFSMPNGLLSFNPCWNFSWSKKFKYLEVLDIRRPSGLIQWTSGSGSPFALHFRLAGWPSMATVCGDLRVSTGGSQINS